MEVLQRFIFELTVSKCPTSQPIGVRLWRANNVFLFVSTEADDCRRRQANTDTVSYKNISCKTPS